MQIFAPTQLLEAVELLRQGGVLVYPTETSYALGCDATNPEAVARVFAIKNRPPGKGVPLILPPESDPSEYIWMSARARNLIKSHWPGPLNVISARQPKSPVSTGCETDGTQSVRLSSHPIAQELARQLNKPLVATSANRSGEMQIYRPDEIQAEFNDDHSPDAMLNAGNLPVVPASTTVKVDGDDLRLIRLGDIVV